MLNGFMVLLTHVQLVVVATGLYQQVCRKLHGTLGDLVVMATVLVTVTDVRTGMVLVVDGIIQKLLLQLAVVHILYVLVEFIDVVQENVQDVMDVHRMLMDIT
jgi:hypothetical protein